MKRLIGTSLLFLAFSVCFPLFAQENNGKAEITRKILKELRAPDDMRCTSFIGAVGISIKKGALDTSFIFSPGFPQSLRHEVKRVFASLNIRELTTKYFDLQPNADYNILLPIAIFPDQYCQISISAKDLGEMLAKGVIGVKMKNPVYVMDGVTASIGRTVY
ncbi:hypothetical protein [Chitinophaga vietnamensis]|uniref:hypothetical protein n=1 Tax=Chitinophaga vietnamensis TaxID=2593957 RepID=UPI0011774D34|nr:hypothetical protein [Chitinophaga vietnamensis]